MTADEYKALQAVRRFGDAARKEVDKIYRKSKETSEKHGKGWDKANKEVLGGLKSIAAGLGLVTGVAGALNLVLERLEKWRNTMDQIALKSAQAGREVTALAMMQAPGMAGTAKELALQTGISVGFGPADAFQVLQSLQAQTGTLQGGVTAFKAAGRLSSLAGVPKVESGRAISTLMGLGTGAERAARLLYGTGEVSSLDPTEIAKAVPMGLPGFSAREGGVEAGFTMMAKLSQVFKDPSMLGTMTERARSGLFAPQREARMQELLAQTGQEGTFMGRIAALKQAGITGTMQFQQFGITEKREQRALSALLRDIVDPVTGETTGALEWMRGAGGRIRQMGGQEGLLGMKRAQAEAEIPQMAYQRVFDVFQAEIEREIKFPTTEEGKSEMRKAEQRSLDQMAKFLAMKRMGGLADIMPTFEPGQIPRVDIKTWTEAKLRTTEEIETDPEYDRYGLLSLFMPSQTGRKEYRQPLVKEYEQIKQKYDVEYNKFAIEREAEMKRRANRRATLTERGEALALEFESLKTSMMGGGVLDVNALNDIRDEMRAVNKELKELNQKIVPGVGNLAPAEKEK